MTQPKSPPPQLDELTIREIEVVVSDHTVKTHVARILAKLGRRDRTQAVIAAYESGLGAPRGLALKLTEGVYSSGPL